MATVAVLWVNSVVNFKTLFPRAINFMNFKIVDSMKLASSEINENLLWQGCISVKYWRRLLFT